MKYPKEDIVRTECKHCGETLDIPQDEYKHLSKGDYSHYECQIDYEELTAK
jgi:hypothetical protein